MGTTADKLAYLAGTKDAIRSAISAKGVSVSENDTFRSYANKISAISSGMQSLGGGPVQSTGTYFSVPIPDGANFFELLIYYTSTGIFSDIYSVTGVPDSITINGSSFYISRDPAQNTMNVQSQSSHPGEIFERYEFFK